MDYNSQQSSGVGSIRTSKDADADAWESEIGELKNKKATCEIGSGIFVYFHLLVAIGSIATL